MSRHSKNSFDLIVIGSGPAGVHAAIQASKLEKSVLLIEKHKEHLGGAWIHTGTLPSKTMREAVASIQSLKYAAGQKWVDRIIHEMSFRQLKDRCSQLVGFEESILQKHLKSNGVNVLSGHASFIDNHTVLVKASNNQTTEVFGQKILIATGSRPRRPEHIPFDGWRVVDSDEILNIDDLPKSLNVYGAGVIGCEYACIFGAMGVKTTVFDERKSIMQSVDSTISQALKESMEQLGIEFKLGHKLLNCKTQDSQCIITTQIEKNTENHSSDLFLFAAGRVPNSEGMNLNEIGLKLNDRGSIIVNDCFQSSQQNIYAAGDVIGPPALAATSSEQGRIACSHAFEHLQRSFPKIYPIGIYTIPELSAIGLTEDETIQQNLPYVVGLASFEEVARGQIRGDKNGILKLIVNSDSLEILGIHVIGEDACNLIHIGLAMMLNKAKVNDFVDAMIFNYPTLAEAYRVAAFNAINKLKTKKSNHEAA